MLAKQDIEICVEFFPMELLIVLSFKYNLDSKKRTQDISLELKKARSFGKYESLVIDRLICSIYSVESTKHAVKCKLEGRSSTLARHCPIVFSKQVTYVTHLDMLQLNA